jgi:shikimate kinase
MPVGLTLSEPNNIILVGFMASGKSVVGEVLSRLTGMPLLDTDDEIVLRAGKPIHQIFQESGEAAFRELEREVIDDICSRSGNVIGAGGGAFVDPDNRELMLTSGWVVCLSARPETILQRISQAQWSDNSKEGVAAVRPLLAGDDPLARIKSLLAQRADAYAQAHYTIEIDRLTPEQVAGRILELCSARSAVNGE